MELLEGGSGLAIYIGLKLTLYTAWSYGGMRHLRPKRPPGWLDALRWGVVRLGIGWVTGILVAPLVVGAVATGHLPLFYATGLVVVRWLEWGLLEVMIAPELGGRSILLGSSRSGRVWRVGAVLASYLADAPFLLTQGFPQGRIFC
jgi:hypothetical protein